QCFREDPPQISELTFTNLFIWRHQYRPVWLPWKDCLLIIFQPKEGAPYGLQPIGSGDKRAALDLLYQEISKFASEVRICRVAEDFVNNHVDADRYVCLPDRNNSDYVYLAEDLINLSGRKYHRKKNQLNQFMKNYAFEYRPLDAELVECFLDMQEAWCKIKECVEKPDLLAEDYAVHEALTWFEDLDYQGGAIFINSNVEAFSLGELMNPESAVIHIEKANPYIPGLYAAINQRFCMNAWSDVTYINREQDMGIEGLRKAKESYQPHHMVNKYTLIPK
ncbi:MAG: phosphatidylglycerol lysyltransferase domain-containing protein, partial [Desulfobacteraceae bacterium]